MFNKNQIVALGVFALLVLSLVLSWVSTDFGSINGWAAFVILNLFYAGLFAGVWWILRIERLPNWLIVFAVGAALLHMAAGVFWLKGLPRWGHGTAAESHGYVMADAYARAVYRYFDLGVVDGAANLAAGAQNAAAGGVKFSTGRFRWGILTFILGCVVAVGWALWAFLQGMVGA